VLQFWALASLNEDTRRTAARAIVEQLAEANCRGADTEGGGGQREQKVSYTLKRLVRGLQSSRDGARQGYCLALTEILCSYEEVLPQRVLDMVAEFMVISGSVKGQEERDVFFGRIFACMALIRSARLGAEDSRRVAELLVGAAGKAFLRQTSPCVPVEVPGDKLPDTLERHPTHASIQPLDYRGRPEKLHLQPPTYPRCVELHPP
jgi:DNA polymerase phi